MRRKLTGPTDTAVRSDYPGLAHGVRRNTSTARARFYVPARAALGKSPIEPRNTPSGPGNRTFVTSSLEKIPMVLSLGFRTGCGGNSPKNCRRSSGKRNEQMGEVRGGSASDVSTCLGRSVSRSLLFRLSQSKEHAGMSARTALQDASWTSSPSSRTARRSLLPSVNCSDPLNDERVSAGESASLPLCPYEECPRPHDGTAAERRVGDGQRAMALGNSSPRREWPSPRASPAPFA